MASGADISLSGSPYTGTIGAGNSGQFPDPFLDMASLAMPRSLKNVLDMCEGIWLKNGTYRMAASRIVRYFITKVEFEDMAEEQRATLSAFMHNRLKVISELSLLGDDFLAYGNSFSSIVLPFRRFLICKGCQVERPIKNIESWSFRDFAFNAYCPKCRKNMPHGHLDRRSTEEDKICVKRWNPHELLINEHTWTKDCEYFWRIPADIANDINKGIPFIVEHMPWEVIESVRKQQLFKFNPGVIYHMKEETLSGISARGWGVSRLLSNFAQAWYTQVLKRYNEALALDYVIPFRVLTPATRSKEGDPLLNMNVSNFAANVQRMLKQHRRDPASWHTLPFPLEYQALGGEAKDLTTPELLDQGMDELLNSIGIPAQLYRGDLELQVMPTALRLFEATWPQLVAQYNGWLEWAVEIICTAMSWDKPEKIALQPVTMADDIEKRAMWMQLASSNLISKRTAFSPWGLDAADEQKRVFQEQKLYDEQALEYQEDQEQKAMTEQVMQGGAGMGMASGGGVPAPGGMGGGGGGVVGTSGGPVTAATPQDLMAEADAMAQQLLQMPYEARRKEMINVKNTNPTLHAMLKQRLEDLRSEASSVGQQAVLQGQVQ